MQKALTPKVSPLPPVVELEESRLSMALKAYSNQPGASNYIALGYFMALRDFSNLGKQLMPNKRLEISNLEMKLTRDAERDKQAQRRLG